MKFKHPNVLSIVEPIMVPPIIYQEDEKCIAFVTENFECPLSHLLSQNLLSQVYSSELEFKIHLTEIIQALTFFHNDVKTIHLGIAPHNIFVTKQGKWKLGGMVFSQSNLENKRIALQLDLTHQKVLLYQPDTIAPQPLLLRTRTPKTRSLLRQRHLLLRSARGQRLQNALPKELSADLRTRRPPQPQPVHEFPVPPIPTGTLTIFSSSKEPSARTPSKDPLSKKSPKTSSSTTPI